jgi:predicted double-glycine peptidase
LTNFRLLSRARQSTEYTCGPSALQAVLRYWGKDVAEGDLAKLAGTTSAVGTFPEDLARSAQALGFKAEVKEGLTLDEVQRFTAAGHPMIALAQVWLSAKGMGVSSVEEEWDSGHYIVVLGVDKEYVYFQDPYILMSKAFLPRKVFEAHWHQAMGGDVVNQPKLNHVGIFVRGKKPAKSAARAKPKADLARLDLGSMGSLNLIVLQFPGALMPYDFLSELRDVWDSGHVRPNAFILLRKDKSGAIAGMEGGRVMEESDVAATNAVLAAIASRRSGRPEAAATKMQTAMNAAATGDFGLSMADIKSVAKELPRDHSAIIILFENIWEKRLKQVAAKHGGAVERQQMMTSEELAAIARKIAAGTKRNRARRKA